MFKGGIIYLKGFEKPLQAVRGIQRPYWPTCGSKKGLGDTRGSWGSPKPM